MIESLDREAARIGVSRHSVIKVWLAELIRFLERGFDIYLPAAEGGI
jgi:hypothetical protein